MNSADSGKTDDSVISGDAGRDASARTQIEQRIQELFRFAGDNDQARQLMRMIIEYRWRQRQ
ncbi:hypothetical protein PROAA_580019 [Candidatus Propionivibrio aalborgensis]|jgi:hypothetical protein|uniref:Uncharacterized protein n=1 Tax=Candidatus Propionivibrio aalborgensis TaxID=1860101 RepID=A0A1A8Y0B9_9RHOO|nr:hypothetical protein [Candidatus Propionivibrio aalborgensis]MBK7324993.1 hypothetical protein [Propionivibrio sp.]MBK7564777.1 hypothetical protein [Propionivibrio sp.]MBK9028852.1 hypothetical protein [Propionivibrio sp.]SBT10615.1 hypothetical protein PROAA_580019 [Candidatus Propionivibrio aalborgensis]